MRVGILILLVVAGAILIESSPVVGTAQALSVVPGDGTGICPPEGIACPQLIRCIPTCWLRQLIQ
jgi:hypothetical protein